jgi:hypothetical protein
VPCLLGDIDAEIVMSGFTAELIPAPIPASARAPVTAMASFFILSSWGMERGVVDQYLREGKSFEALAPRRIEHLSSYVVKNCGAL